METLSPRRILITIALVALLSTVSFFLIRKESLPQAWRGPSAVSDQSEKQLLLKNGAPESSKEFAMSEVNDEFHADLLNIYPLNKPENQQIRIREMTWIDGDHRLTVWLHKTDLGWSTVRSKAWSKAKEL